MSADRPEVLDRLAMGSRCTRCGAHPDEPCRTRRTGQATAPHQERVDRAVRQWQTAR
jgi:hypothetical protein